MHRNLHTLKSAVANCSQIESISEPMREILLTSTVSDTLSSVELRTYNTIIVNLNTLRSRNVDSYFDHLDKIFGERVIHCANCGESYISCFVNKTNDCIWSSSISLTSGSSLLSHCWRATKGIVIRTDEDLFVIFKRGISPDKDHKIHYLFGMFRYNRANVIKKFMTVIKYKSCATDDTTIEAE